MWLWLKKKKKNSYHFQWPRLRSGTFSHCHFRVSEWIQTKKNRSGFIWFVSSSKVGPVEANTNNRIFPFFIRFQSPDGDTVFILFMFFAGAPFILHVLGSRMHLVAVLCLSNNLQLSIIHPSEANGSRPSRKKLYRHYVLWTKSFSSAFCRFCFGSSGIGTVSVSVSGCLSTHADRYIMHTSVER